MSERLYGYYFVQDKFNVLATLTLLLFLLLSSVGGRRARGICLVDSGERGPEWVRSHSFSPRVAALRFPKYRGLIKVRTAFTVYRKGNRLICHSSISRDQPSLIVAVTLVRNDLAGAKARCRKTILIGGNSGTFTLGAAV